MRFRSLLCALHLTGSVGMAEDESEAILRKNRELLAKADAESDRIIREGIDDDQQ